MAQQQFSGRVGEVAHGAAHPAGHDGLLDSNASEHRVFTASNASDVDAPAAVAPQRAWVVLGKAIKPALAILRMRLSLLKLRTKIAVLALQRPNPLSKQGQSLAQDRRRAVHPSTKEMEVKTQAPHAETHCIQPRPAPFFQETHCSQCGIPQGPGNSGYSRCTHHPKDLNGLPVAAESGVLPSIRVQAVSAEQADLLAHAATGCVIANVERLEGEVA